MKRRRVLWGGLGLIAFVAAGMVAAFGWVRAELRPLPPGPEVEVTVPAGADVRAIGRALQKAGLIRNDIVFWAYVRLMRPDAAGRLQAGVYRFRPGMTLEAIVDALARGDVYRETVTFTIPEGFTVEEIADRLQTLGLVDRDVFLREVKEGDFAFRYLDRIPVSPERKYRLEGYLFPDTYTVDKNASAHAIIERMLRRFEEMFPEAWAERAAVLGLSVDQAVTLASIVEREAVRDDERARIAGVFYNRIKARWRLESCATVEYVLDVHKERLTLEDLKVNDPYNTYLHDGLPPGPIANPGKKSLEAVLWPEEHDYFFFVAKNDGSGGHYFSKTYEEHLRHNAKSSGNF
ncbi:endolytic transglycosylase MltG [Hydrogenibacillus schlegelii]|uniref:Endolytic murein transglycosylase n=1 Tax=Hydrogenibacillus schlegelii TaxID=1484 RepID=A0A179IUY5_HYDSH|nr:endolytic transglycosylase MltG [Hydrogenibacillus schlegelii]OAR05474.1 hypothetical protein SA87_11325 [Hydrogenibacillus schlegelii]